MTREEQIIETAKSIYSPSSGIPQSLPMRVGFIEGAKWADEHPNLSEEEQVGMGGLGMIWQKKHLIEKACKWLENELYSTHDNCGYKITTSFDSVDKNEFIEYFKKAMEE